MWMESLQESRLHTAHGMIHSDLLREKREMLPSGKGRKGGSASGLLLIQHPLSLCHQEPNTLKVEAGLGPQAQLVTIS